LLPQAGKRFLFGIPLPLTIFLLAAILQPFQPLWKNRVSFPRGKNARNRHVDLSDLGGSYEDYERKDTFNVDAVVFVAIGPAATSPVIKWAIQSVVETGEWNGTVYVLTDQPDSIEDALISVVAPDNLNVLNLLESGKEAMPWSLHSFNAKIVKCRLLHILPVHINSILYIDGDIIVGRSLETFWTNLDRIWSSGGRRGTALRRDIDVSLGMFEDCNAYTAGYCADCNTWNSGVMSIVRGKSDGCLDSWCEALAVTGGKDQAALDDVIAQGEHCQDIAALDRGHVRMMKDTFVLNGLVSTKTFNHYTGIFRPHLLLPVHRNFYEKKLGHQFDTLEHPRTGIQRVRWI
jgi:hypothetical protein